MFIDDKPIDRIEDDVLGRYEYASKFASALCEYDKKEPIVIGVNGPWGSGKTSLVNMITNKVAEISKTEDKDLKIINFEPWNYSSVNQLIEQYFYMLAKEFASSKDNAYRSIGDLLEKYGKGISGALETIIPAANIMSTILTEVGSKIKQESVYDAKDLSMQRNEIIERLSSYAGRILVIIDDIDRLTFLQIRELFRLVASVASFPNTIFILSFDKRIVSDALKELQGSGENYLEKIVQVSVEIPPITKDQIARFFSARFEGFIRNDSSMVFQKKYWDQVFMHILEMIDNLRDVVRLSNTVDIKMSMIGEQINFADMLILSCIELKHHKLYKWIYENKDRLTGGIRYSISSFDEKPSSQKLEDDINSLNLEMNTSEVIEMLSLMFPTINDYTHQNWRLPESKDSLVRNQRIAESSKFDRYFVMSIGDDQISRREFNYAIDNYSDEELNVYIVSLADSGKSYELISEIKALFSEQDYKDSKKWARILMNAFPHIKSSASQTRLLSPKITTEYLLFDLLVNIYKQDAKVVYDVLSERIKNADYEDLDVLSAILHQEALALGVISTDNSSQYRMFMTEDAFHKLSKEYLTRALEIDKENNLLDSDSGSAILKVIKWFFPDEYRRYIEKKLDEDINTLKYIANNVGAGTYATGSESGITYTMNEELSKEEYISFSEADRIIESCLENGSIISLRSDQVIKLAAYSLRASFEKNMGATETACQAKLEEWEKRKLSNL